MTPREQDRERDQIEAAYVSLLGRGCDRIGDLSTGTVARAALGSPERDPDRHTAAETRLARELLAQTWLRLEEVQTARALDAALDRVRVALGLELAEDASPADVAAAVEQLVAAGRTP